MTPSPRKQAGTGPDAKCLARSVSKVFADEPTVEAVTVNRQQKTISVATLGQVDVPKIQEKISTTIQTAEADAEHPCGLLAGEVRCAACTTPLSPNEFQAITFRKEGDSMTIARVTCPTAPNFWRWREIPWPKVVQRDVEFIEHAGEEDEWKAQMVAAALCGIFGLTAYFFRHTPTAIFFYLAAYLTGGWFTAQEVWERFRQRTIDVHFLMLAVAAAAPASARGARVRLCCSCSRCRARWNILRWGGHNTRSARSFGKHRRSRRGWTLPGTKWRRRWRRCGGACACW